MLRHKHLQKVRDIMSLQGKGKPTNSTRKDLNYTITEETKYNLSLGAINGIIVKVFDVNNNFLKEYPTITCAANHYNVDRYTLSKCIKTGNQIKNHYFKAQLKNVNLSIYDKLHNLIKVCTSANKVTKFCETSHTAIGRYIKPGKL